MPGRLFLFDPTHVLKTARSNDGDASLIMKQFCKVGYAWIRRICRDSK
jgi:hypothetical protein